MELSVKGRIALAMGVVVAANLAAVAIGWYFNARAADFGAEARRAGTTAQRATLVAQYATEFVGASVDLASAVTHVEQPQEASAVYGQVMGADTSVTEALAAFSKQADPADATVIAAQWEDLRLSVYAAINAEAEAAGAPLRIARLADGRFRASVTSNLTVPKDLRGLYGSDLRAAVRGKSDAFVGATLRSVVGRAESTSRSTVRAEQDARATAQGVTAAIVLISLVAAVAVALWLYGSIARPLSRAKLYADAVAGGDWDAVLDLRSDDEIGQLAAAVEDMKDAVVHKIAVIREMAGAVMVTADDVGSAAARALESIHADHPLDRARAPQDVADVVSRVERLSDLAAQMLTE